MLVLVMYLQANEAYKTLEKGPNVQSSLQTCQLFKQKTTLSSSRKQPPEKTKKKLLNILTETAPSANFLTMFRC